LAGREAEHSDIVSRWQPQGGARLQFKEGSRSEVRESGGYDRALSKLKNIFQPWLQVTDPDQYADNYYQGAGMTDAFIDYKIQNLINYCPTKKK
jgi:hypothetical protein